MKFLAHSRNICKWEKKGECTCPACITVSKDEFEANGSKFCLHPSKLMNDGSGCSFFR